MSNWLNSLLEETDEAESPKNFILWGGLSAIAAVMRRNVWVPKGKLYKLYPNIYVMLIAPSGGRKGFPVALSRKLVEKVGNTRIINGRSSIQAIIQELGTAHSLEGRSPLVDAHAFLSFPEFGSSLVEDPDSLTILTDLYDTHAHDVWTSNLKSTGKTHLKNPCLTILAASNEAHFHDKVGETSVLGGFVARTIIVDEKKKSRINPLIDDSEKEIDINALAQYLIKLSNLSGPFVWSPGAKKIYVDWYTDFSEKLEANENADTTGTSDRVHDTVIKTAMLLSLADKPELIIETRGINAAIELCLKSAGDTARVTKGGGKSEHTVAMRKILTELLSRKDYTATRVSLLQKFYMDFDSPTFDRIVQTMMDAGALESVGGGRNQAFILNKKVAEYYKKAVKE